MGTRFIIPMRVNYPEMNRKYAGVGKINQPITNKLNRTCANFETATNNLFASYPRCMF